MDGARVKKTEEIFRVAVELAVDNRESFLAAQIQIRGAGTIRRLDLRDASATADFDGDGDKDLADYVVFRASFRGPGVMSPMSCNATDLNGDGYVDLRDFGILQAAFTLGGSE